MDRSSDLDTFLDPAGPPTDHGCPYLLSADGGWRASTPVREHRCMAVAPAAVLAQDKQRRLCLTADHAHCATYLAASGHAIEGPDAGVAAVSRAGARPVARTTPRVLDHGRVNFVLPQIRAQRGVGQAVLLGLMALAFMAIAVSRLTSAGDSGPGGATGAALGRPSPSPTAASSVAAQPTADPTLDPSPTPVKTLVPTEVDPSAAPTDAPSAQAGTYKVKGGDTLSGIAAKFGTTWQVLAELNGIKDPSRLKIGVVLDLP